MNGFDFDQEDDTQTVFRDVLTLALAGVTVSVVLLLPHLHPPAAATTAGLEPPGNVIIEARWPDDVDTDVDLWVQGPGDVPVGYSNKGGKLFNLLRDDLGKRGDATGLNYEVSYSRGVTSGEYIVNLHLYRNPAHVEPVKVSVVASVKRNAKDSAKQVLVSDVDLAREGQEMTVFRFNLAEDGSLVPGSVHSVQKPLRAWRAK